MATEHNEVLPDHAEGEWTPEYTEGRHAPDYTDEDWMHSPAELLAITEARALMRVPPDPQPASSNTFQGYWKTPAWYKLWEAYVYSLIRRENKPYNA